MNVVAKQNWSAVEQAFSRQSLHYDADDIANPILQAWREKVYRHVMRHLKAGARILELNAGTGIDAMHFAKGGYKVLATDIAEGMIEKIKQKINNNDLANRLTARQCSYLHLDELKENGPFDFVFSNFGGLNCVDDLSFLRDPLRKMLSPGAHLTLVIMPPVCPWELMTTFKGNRQGLRRFSSDGSSAQLEGYGFRSYYHTVKNVSTALGPDFHLVECESLGLFSAPPSASWIADRYRFIHRALLRVDNLLTHTFPFNRCGDHIILSFRYC